MKHKLILACLFSFSVATLAVATEDENPAKLCERIDGSMVLTKSCSINEAEKTIGFEIDLEAKHAEALCGSLRRIGQSNGWVLSEGWKIQIKSAETGDTPMAECEFEKGKKYYS